MKYICIKSYPFWKEGDTTEQEMGNWSIKLSDYPEYWKEIGPEDVYG